MKTLAKLLLGFTLTVGVIARPTDDATETESVGNSRPIIGVLTQPSASDFADEFIRTLYVSYLEMGGARVVPIRSDTQRGLFL
ncbi:gamma-glutamyl hydrolase [Elysia marginata]|uniref:Gamma-glutamyl hydrolase n=1 Tax=Elysia marginata TaxID=1093978 RepID=A0AAV4IYI8_9GAST|nr:gamma-glutamyl hydrolase [Elysia marginata]